MSPRTLKGLAAALLGLALLWALLLHLERRAPGPAPLWADAESAGKILLQGPGAGEVLLVRETSSWRLKEPFDQPADADAVQALLRKLAHVSVSEPLSASFERHAAFGLLEPGLRLKAFALPTDAEPALDLLVGAPGPDFDSFFFRRPPSGEVREARGLARGELEREGGEWADRLLCSIASDTVRAVEARSKASALVLSGPPLAEPAAAPVLAALARLQADRALPEKDAAPSVLRSLADPWLRLKVRYAQRAGPAAPERTLEVFFGPRTEDQAHYARVKGREGVLFKLSAWKLAPFQAAQ